MFSIKRMRSIEVFIIFSVRTLHLAVMTRCVRFDELVSYPTLFEASLKQCGSGLPSVTKSFCKLCSVIGLYTLYREFKCLEHMLQKHRRGVCIMFFKGFKIPKS